MIHQPKSAYFEGPTGELLLEAEEILRLRENLTTVYAERTTTPFWRITIDMERDTFMSAWEALAYGIVDLVGLDEDELVDPA